MSRVFFAIAIWLSRRCATLGAQLQTRHNIREHLLEG
jgi:hypothetical protein